MEILTNRYKNNRIIVDDTTYEIQNGKVTIPDHFTEIKCLCGVPLQIYRGKYIRIKNTFHHDIGCDTIEYLDSSTIKQKCREDYSTIEKLLNKQLERLFSTQAPSNCNNNNRHGQNTCIGTNNSKIYFEIFELSSESNFSEFSGKFGLYKMKSNIEYKSERNYTGYNLFDDKISIYHRSHCDTQIMESSYNTISTLGTNINEELEYDVFVMGTPIFDYSRLQFKENNPVFHSYFFKDN